MANGPLPAWNAVEEFLRRKGTVTERLALYQPLQCRYVLVQIIKPYGLLANQKIGNDILWKSWCLWAMSHVRTITTYRVLSALCRCAWIHLRNNRAFEDESRRDSWRLGYIARVAVKTLMSLNFYKTSAGDLGRPLASGSTCKQEEVRIPNPAFGSQQWEVSRRSHTFRDVHLQDVIAANNNMQW